MLYRKACKIKVGDVVTDKQTGINTTVLEITKDNDSNDLFFRCICNGKVSTYHHSAIRLPLSTEEQAELYLKDKNTRVFIDYINEIGEWLYSVVVDKSDGFWLDSFPTHKEAEDYIKEHNLKMIDDAA